MNYYNYFTEIEELFVRRRGKHMFVSPMDWSLIATWRDSGVPLHVALRGIDIAMDTWHSKPHRGSDRLSTLFYCHDAVMAEYARHLEAHLGEDTERGSTEPTGDGSGSGERASADDLNKNSLLEFLDARISEIEALRTKHYSCGDTGARDRARLRLGEIRDSIATEEHPEVEALERDLRILDELLISDLKNRLREGQMEEWEREARAELKVYKKRLPKETYEKILGNFLCGKIRRTFNLGELSLFHL